MRRTMWEHVSIVRTEVGLERARASLGRCRDALDQCRVVTPADIAALLELERMLLVAQAVVIAARDRKESRGSHCRTDYPARDDARWLGSTRVEKVGKALEVSFVPLG